MMAFFAKRVLERRMYQRLDRICHGGIVTYRLPFSYRLDCGNGSFNRWKRLKRSLRASVACA